MALERCLDAYGVGHGEGWMRLRTTLKFSVEIVIEIDMNYA